MKHRPLTKIRHELHLARELVNTLSEELQAAREAACDIHVGDVVRVTSTWRTNGRYLVTSIDFWDGRDKPSLEGRLEKKGGGWGVRQVYIGNEWEKVT